MKVALSAGNQAQKSDSLLSKPLKSQAFATPDKVAELIQKVCSVNPFQYDCLARCMLTIKGA